MNDTDLKRLILDLLGCMDKHRGLSTAEINALAALVARREALAKPGWTIEIPNLKYFQITAFDNSDKQWVTPIYDTANLLASGAALTTKATQGEKGETDD